MSVRASLPQGHLGSEPQSERRFTGEEKPQNKTEIVRWCTDWNKSFNMSKSVHNVTLVFLSPDPSVLVSKYS